HAGRHEQSRELRCFLRTTHMLLQPPIVVDRPLRRDQRICPSVPDDRLAATVAESGEIGIIGPDHKPVLFYRLIPQTLIGGSCDRGPVELRILRQEVSEPVQGDRERLRLRRSPPAAPERAQVGSPRLAVPKEAPVFPPRSLPELPNQVGIGICDYTAVAGR